jgi:hypothetical protein
LVNKELCGFRRRVVSVHRSPEGVGKVGWFGPIDDSIHSVESGVKEVLTAASNAVEFASRQRVIGSAKWLKLLKFSKRNFENF